MKSRLSAVLALVSAVGYAACGSSDDKKTRDSDGESGRGGTAGGDGKGSGGTSSKPAEGGEAGEAMGGNAAGEGGTGVGGSGNEGGGNESGSGGTEMGGMTGLAGADPMGGAGGMGIDKGRVPTGCPGVETDYTVLEGTSAGNYFDQVGEGGFPLTGSTLALGLEGADSFTGSYDGTDCLVGGPDDDTFYSPSEAGVAYFVGGPGADTYVLSGANGGVNIVDMVSGEDKIDLVMSAFNITAEPGPADPSTVIELAGWSTGTQYSGEGMRIAYDPDNGELWYDPNGDSKDAGSVKIGAILADYELAITDFEFE